MNHRELKDLIRQLSAAEDLDLKDFKRIKTELDEELIKRVSPNSDEEAKKIIASWELRKSQQEDENLNATNNLITRFIEFFTSAKTVPYAGAAFASIAILSITLGILLTSKLPTPDNIDLYNPMTNYNKSNDFVVERGLSKDDIDSILANDYSLYEKDGFDSKSENLRYLSLTEETISNSEPYSQIRFTELTKFFHNNSVDYYVESSPQNIAIEFMGSQKTLDGLRQLNIKSEPGKKVLIQLTK